MEKQDIIHSLKGMKKAEPNPFLFTRIQAKLNAEAEVVSRPDWLTRLAFGVGIFLIVMNLMIIRTPQSSENLVANVEEVEILEDSLLYSSIVQNYNFYENGSD